MVAGLLVTAASVQAQQIYRIVGANGRVTFTDVPPTNVPQQNIALINTILAPGTVNTSGLSFDLQQIALKYPVVLYTTNSCPSCEQGRRFLMARGIPFAEKTVTSAEEVDAFLKMSGDSPMPYLTIGKESVKGFIEGDWSSYLTAAAYPQSSQLPAGYKYAAAAPLIEKRPPPPPPETASAPAPAAAQTGPTPDNPAGIRF